MADICTRSIHMHFMKRKYLLFVSNLKKLYSLWRNWQYIGTESCDGIAPQTGKPLHEPMTAQFSIYASLGVMEACCRMKSLSGFDN